jgi:cytochrome P450
VENENGKRTFMDMLFELNDNGKSLSEQDIVDEVVTMLIAVRFS